MSIAIFRRAVLGVAIAVAAGSAQGAFFEFTRDGLQRAPEATQTECQVVRGQDEKGDPCYDSCQEACGSCCDPCGCGGIGTWRDNTVLYLASDNWKDVGDIDFPNNFGYRAGFNTGFRLGDSALRGQVGASYGGYDLKGNIARVFGPFDVEQQIFFTGGVYKRSDVYSGDRIAWGVVYDYMYDTRWGVVGNDEGVGQVRWQIGYAWDEDDEFGVWGAFRAQSDIVPFFGPIRAIDQTSMFWHHNWAFGGDTTFYVGAADSPSSWVFGANGQVPLSDNAALFAATTFFVPGAATGTFNAQLYDTWNVTAGLCFFLGPKAVNDSVSGNAGLPLLNVADNGSFGIQD